MKPGPKAIIRELLARLEEVETAIQSVSPDNAKKMRSVLSEVRQRANEYVNRKPAKRNARKRPAGELPELKLKPGQTVNIFSEVEGFEDIRLYSVTYHGEGMVEVHSPHTDLTIAPVDRGTLHLFKGGNRK